ncbi:MAG TPA: THUMP domain-containing protein [Bacteroidia bacterium]|nr:THUMP domain-containing protein [Bacteroidia bacterium]
MKNILSGQLNLVVSCHYGFEELLAEELKVLGLENIQLHNRAVVCTGTMAHVYNANYNCRLALRVLIKIATFEAPDGNTLYEEVYDLPWEQIIQPNNTIAINSICNQSAFDNTMFVSMRAKDAIADFFRHRTGIRPSVDNDHPDLRIQVHIFKEQATVLLDSSGNSLHMRGYRIGVNKAPINEVLAAGLIVKSGWQPEMAFYDPMCGSGTFLIEAAMMATNTPAGFYRKEFGFERWKNFDQQTFDDIVNESNAKRKLKVTAPIEGSDSARKSLTIARDNIKHTDFSGIIKTSLADFETAPAPEFPGTIIINPPYGGRLDKDDIEILYKRIGDTLKKNYGGHTAWIITANREAAKHIGLHASKKYVVFNGQLECRFLKYELYAGSKKAKHIDIE